MNDSKRQRHWTARPWTREETGAPGSPLDGVPVQVQGVQVDDADRRLSYRVTLGRVSGPTLRTCEVAPWDPEEVVTIADLRRVPVATLATFAAAYLAGQGAKERATLRGTPESEEVAAMRRAGMTREEIAARYGRTPSAVSQWIRRAYREVPEQMPPRRGGRRPETDATTTD